MYRLFLNLILTMVASLLFVGAHAGIADDCTFVGIVRAPTASFDCTQGSDYDVLMRYMAYTAWQDHTDAGWSVTSYRYDPFSVVYQVRKNCNDPQLYDSNGGPSTTYSTEYCNAVTGTNIVATLVVGHARNVSNAHPLWYHADADNPHPFVYDPLDNPPPYYYRMFDKPYSFLHNGGLQVVRIAGQPTGLADRTAVGFCALDIFNDREWAVWYHPGEEDKPNDTEHYAMIIMKYLMVQENYYWAGPSNTPPTGVSSMEEWAIRKVAQDTPIPTDWNTSMNGIFNDGASMWVVAKSDLAYPHRVWYNDVEQDFHKVASASNPGGYEELEANGNGKVAWLTYNNEVEEHDIGGPGTLANPTELRINGAAYQINGISYSRGDQREPAISVDPSSGSNGGSWVAVWSSESYRIRGRWYNQMGMAENDEFIVADWTEGLGMKGWPAIAHSNDGQTITIVWLEATFPGQTLQTYGYAYLKRRSFSWDQDTHSWNGGDTYLVAENTCGGYPYLDQLAHPTIAYAPNGDYAIAWEKILCAPSTHTEIHAVVLNGNTFVVPEQTIAVDGDDHEPDIAYIGPNTFAIAYNGPIPGTDYLKVALLHETTPYIQGPYTLAANGYHASIAPLDDTHFFVAYTNGSIKIDKCEIQENNVQVVLSVTGESVDTDSRPDIAICGTDGTYYVCYDKENNPYGRDIYCARGSGDQLNIEPQVNLFPDYDQKWPAIAVAQSYPINNGFYLAHSQSGIFEKRRMIIWQSFGQDHDPNPPSEPADWGIAGQFRGIEGSSRYEWSAADPFIDNYLPDLPGTITQSISISNSFVCMTSNVDVLEGATLTFTSGVTIYAAPGCSLRVAGGLVVNSGCQFTMLEPPARWGGIYVSGSASLSGCTIDGAETGISTKIADQLTVDGCAILGNGVGVYIYAPKTGAPEISNCTVTNNETDGISLFSTYNAGIHDCPNISGNGKNGILLNDSYANISNNHFTDNAQYGVYCYGSSPTLYCNDFSEDHSGEMYLVKGSYPILWSSIDQDGGSNTFVATDRTLITMIDSYPIVNGGLNYFTIYGTRGFYMADLSDNIPKHDVTGNDWWPNPPPESAFFPSDYEYWIWDPPKDYVGCGSPKEGGSNAAQMLFEQGYAAEMAGNTAVASTDYMATIAQYPDSSWAQVAAVRLFENQRQIGYAFSELGAYYANIETIYPEDTSLVETVQDLGTRTLVEDAQYPPALNTYEEIIANPPSLIDSAYAVVDHAITVLRELYESPGGLDSPFQVSEKTIRDLLQGLHQVIPPVPEANHENYMKLPENYVLEQNYPNPFNATTTLRYAVPSSGLVRLTVYNILGQKVAILVDEQQDAGYHSVIWNCTNLASGVYIYQLQAEGHTLTRKLVLLK